ncbi:hypothetical protein D8M36_04255 [Dermabacter sp. HSID17554]|nr:hypothetical protein D8M36_04255 [Dermabacter sp. HSID17554]
MTMTQPRALKKIAALLMIPFVLLVAGCGKLEATLTVESDEKVVLEGVVTGQTSSLDLIGAKPADVCSAKDTTNDGGETTQGKVEVKLTESGDTFECEFTSTVEDAKDIKKILTYDEDSNTYTLKSMLPLPRIADQLAGGGFTADVTIVMPGKVTESSVGTIDGNKVHITDIKEFLSEYEIKSEGSGFPWLIVIIVVVVLVLLFVVVAAAAALFFLMRKKKKGAAANVQNFQQQGQPPFSQNPSPAFPQQAQQFQQPQWSQPHNQAPQQSQPYQGNGPQNFYGDQGPTSANH